MLSMRTLAVAAATVVASLAFAGAASAANTITVNSTVDAAQNAAGTMNQDCETANGCTLRAAVQMANEKGGAWTIVLPAGTYKLTIDEPNPGTNNASAGDLDVMGSQIALDGAGSVNTIIDPSGCTNTPCGRAFYVHTGASLSPTGVTFQHGDSAPNGGSGQYELNAGAGGAIYSDGTLDLSRGDDVFTGNAAGATALAQKFGCAKQADSILGGGGAVFASDATGSVLSTIYGDTFTDNTIRTGSGGGAVENASSSALSILFSVFTGNVDNSSFGGGGAVDQALGGALAIDHAYFAHNTAPYGGAVDSDGAGNVSVTNSLFDSNSSTESGSECTDKAIGGGAIYQNAAGSSVSVSTSSFDNNQAANDGGAIYDNNSDSFAISLVKFADNSATNHGGALYLNSQASGTPAYTLTNDAFDHNAAGGDGGGVYWGAGTFKAGASSFIHNSASGGGALYVDSAHTLWSENTTMSQNTAGNGGAIYMNATTPTSLTNDTIALNAASGSGGGIENPQDFVISSSAGTGTGIVNTIIANNAGLDCGGNAPFNASFDKGFNQDSDKTCLGGLGVPTDKPGVNANLKAPDNNGGPAAGFPGDTLVLATMAEQANSPSVDTGTNTGCPSTDERGAARDNDPCDVGAYELAAGPAGTTTTTTTSTTSHTTTTTTFKPHRHHRHCPKGKVLKNGKCVKKHHKKHKP